MKKKIFTSLILTALIGYKSLATHFIGSEISYAKLAPGTYVVTLKKYHLCPSLPANTEEVLVKANTCANGKVITLQKTGYQMSPLYGSGYNPCGTNNTTFFGSITYQGTLSFSATEQLCTDWQLSNTDASRGPVANATQAANTYNLYTETTLKLDSLFNNHSPQFDAINPVVPVVSVGQPVLLSMSATDLDGDSLTYELVQPLGNQNTPIPYSTIAGPAHSFLNPDFVDPNDGYWKVYNRVITSNCSTIYKNNPFDFTDSRPLQLAIVPQTLPSHYTPEYPMPSYLPINWDLCNQNLYASKLFQLNPQNGSLEVYPAYYDNSNAMGANTYMVSVMVKEWRNVNGMPTLLSQVRRETVIIVGPAATNMQPRLANQNGGASIDKEFIVTSGSTLNYTFLTTDANAGDSITMHSNAVTNLPGAVFQVTNAKLPAGTLTWTPTATQARRQPYYFNILLKDNASLRGYTIETIKVEVRKSNVSGIEKGLTKSLALSAFPNPFSDVINFNVNLAAKSNAQLIIYNILGREVDRIELKNLPAGEQTVAWKNASKIPSGHYIARMVNDKNQSQLVKFVKL